MFVLRMAVNFAHACRCKKVILNHFSQRYKPYSRMVKEFNESSNTKTSFEEIKTDQIILKEGRECAKEFKEEIIVDIAEDLRLFQIPFRK